MGYRIADPGSENGIRKCAQLGRIPVSVAIDTWGVDYVLLDREGERMDPVYAYRNDRTKTFQKRLKRSFPLQIFIGVQGSRSRISTPCISSAVTGTAAGWIVRRGS